MALTQLKKAERGCDQVNDGNATHKQTITQLKAANPSENKNLYSELLIFLEDNRGEIIFDIQTWKDLDTKLKF
nr:unnamed protein product [Callosobruchus chinensis]